MASPFLFTRKTDPNPLSKLKSIPKAGKGFSIQTTPSSRVEKALIDRWRPIKAYIIEHVTKRGIKATIKATTARYYGTIYKHSIEPIQGTHNQKIRHNSNLWYSLETSIRRLYHQRFFGKHHTCDHLKKVLCDIFWYRDEVASSSRQVHLTEDFCFIM